MKIVKYYSFINEIKGKKLIKTVLVPNLWVVIHVTFLLYFIIRYNVVNIELSHANQRASIFSPYCVPWIRNNILLAQRSTEKSGSARF